MRLTEIEYGHWNNPTLPENEPILDSTIIGNFDGYEIHHIDDYYFIPDEQHCYMGYIRIDGNEFREAYVSSIHRRKGIASMLILFAVRNINKKLIIKSDEIVTDDSRQLFYNLAALNKISISSDNTVLTIRELGISL